MGGRWRRVVFERVEGLAANALRSCSFSLVLVDVLLILSQLARVSDVYYPQLMQGKLLPELGWFIYIDSSNWLHRQCPGVASLFALADS